MVGNAARQHDPERRNDRPLIGRGWAVTCPTCGRSRVVTREQVLAGTWIRCDCEQATREEGGGDPWAG